MVLLGERLSDKNGVNDFSCEFIDPSILTKEHDAVVLACGAEMSRDLIIPGRNLDGVHFAMEFLPQQNRVVAGDEVLNQISARGKHVVVIGGGTPVQIVWVPLTAREHDRLLSLN